MAGEGAPWQIVFDCDPGIDDALALAVVADAVRSGRATLAAVVAVGGNVALADTAANVGFLTGSFGLDVPTYAGAADPIAGPTPGDAAEVHGADGIGGLRPPQVGKPPTPATPAQLVDVLAALAPAGGRRVLLATGPLTNLAAMVQCEPDLARLVDRVVVMGGAFGDPSGNVTRHAEFNVWVDPEAWAIVAAAGLPLDVVPLDVTTKVTLTRDDLPSLLTDAGDPTLVSALVASGIDLYDALLGTPFCEMHDPLAAAVIFEPDLVEWRSGPVTVDLDGDERGRTVLHDATESGGRPARVALGIDVDRARASLMASLGAVADR